MTPSSAVTRYWDRITHPEQIDLVAATGWSPSCSIRRIAARPFIALPQDVQEWPGIIRKPSSNRPSMPFRVRAPTSIVLAQALELLASAKRPLIISGGGVRYSGAEDVLGAFAPSTAFRLPRPSPGKGALTHASPGPCRPDRHCRLDLGQRSGS